MNTPKESKDELNKNKIISEKKKEIETPQLEQEKIQSELNHQKAKKRKIILISLTIILLISFIVIAIIFINKTQKEKKIDQGNFEVPSTNYIKAVYEMEQNKNLKIFNPDSVGLKKEDYIIQITKEEKNVGRLLTEIPDSLTELNTIIKESEFTPKISGNFEVKIFFLKNLNTMSEIFKNCNKLIFADFSKLEGTDISSMTSAFENCEKLKNVNFTNMKTSNVTSMDNLFNNCTNLIEANFSSIDMTKVSSSVNMFMNCLNIISVDLSSFFLTNSLNGQNMFTGCDNLKNLDLSKFDSVSPDLFGGKTDLSNINIKVNVKITISQDIIGSFVNDFLPDVKCALGEGEKCKTCLGTTYWRFYCGTCNEGYYVPYDDFRILKCKSCIEDINGCKSCKGEKNGAYCDWCEKGLTLYNGKCYEKCIIGEKDFCESCGTGENMTYCESCNKGFYIALSGNKGGKEKKCKSCQIEKCERCSQNLNLNEFPIKCDKCEDGYTLIENKCQKSCEIGENEKCKTCKYIIDHTDSCELCNEGYYLSKGDDKVCTKCLIDNCEKCSGDISTQKCDKCKEDFILSGNKCLKNCEIGEKDKCKSCDETPGKIDQCLSCNPGYYLQNGLCEPCSIDNCTECSLINDIKQCTKCSDGYMIENETCVIDNTTLPDRIDLVINGSIVPGVYDTYQTYVVKTQNSDNLQYSNSGTFGAPSTSYWWKGFTPNQSIDVAFHFESLLNGKNLTEGYTAYWHGSVYYTSSSGNVELSASTSPAVCSSWDYSWGSNWNGPFGCPHFGYYYVLETSKHNGNIYNGGVYERSRTYWQLTNFTVPYGVGKDVTAVGQHMSISVGTYSAVSGYYLTQRMIINDLYLIKNTK